MIWKRWIKKVIEPKFSIVTKNSSRYSLYSIVARLKSNFLLSMFAPFMPVGAIIFLR